MYDSTAGLTYSARVYLWIIGLAPALWVAEAVIFTDGRIVHGIALLIPFYFFSILFSVPAFIVFWISYLVIKRMSSSNWTKKIVLFCIVVILEIVSLGILDAMLITSNLFLLSCYMICSVFAIYIVKLPDRSLKSV